MQVIQTDEAVFDAVEAKFSTLTAGLLPKLVGQCIHIYVLVHHGETQAHELGFVL